MLFHFANGRRPQTVTVVTCLPKHGCQYTVMSASGLSSKFFPPPYTLDVDDPPLSMIDIAKQKLLHVTQRLPDPTPSPRVQDQQHHLALLTDSPGYTVFFISCLDLYERLLNAKPVLIQGTFCFCGLKGLHSTLNLHVIQSVSHTTHGSSLLL